MSTSELPTIASDIWSESPLDNFDDVQISRRSKHKTGSKAIDDAFEGGLDIGAVHCITSKAEHGAHDLSLGLLATHLLHGPQWSATIIDSTPTFDVRRLHQAIRNTIPDSEDAMEPLTRLKISKVFDRVGMVEAIAELDEFLRSGTALQRPPQTPVIEDSEDEEEILDTAVPAPANNDAIDSAMSSRLLVINNISHVMGPIIKNDYTLGQALLTSLLHSITDITKRHNLCTILFCEASFKLVSEDETLSHFKSCRIKPAVGYGIGYLVDVHIYLHKIFVKRPAPEGTGEGQTARGKEMPSVSVLEIVEDRDGSRRGSWACFDYTPHGTLRDAQ